MGKPLFQTIMSQQDFYNVCVWLPNREQLDITIGVKATGQELFDKVCESMNIKEANFFGLSVVKNNEYIFIDLEQKLNKYFPKEWKKGESKTTEKYSPPCVTFFRVQYYVENGRIISDKIARKLYYYHLKEQVLRSHCTHKEEVYFLLAAYAFQADFGNQSVHMKNYFEPEGYFPHWIIAKRGSDYILKYAPEMHKEQQGMSIKEAVLNFIKESSLLEDVSVHYYRLQKEKREEHPSIILGVTLRGMHIYQEVNHVRHLLYEFPWSNVGKIAVIGKKFEIQPDGLPSARKLVYYTGSAFRSQHLLQLLSNSHRLYLNIQPVQKQIRKLEEKEEKKCYREFYISDNMEMDLDQSDMYSHGSSQGSAKQNRLSRQSTVSHSSSHTSGIEADSHYSMSVEMSVDEPFGIQRGQEKLFCSVNHSNSGIDGGSKETIQRGSQDYGKEVELSVDNPHQVPVIDTLRTNTLFMETEEVSVDFPTLDYHCWQVMKQRGQSVDSLVKTKPQNLSDHYSQSLDDVRFNQQNHPQFTASALTPDTSQSYTFGSATEDKMMDFCATYTTADCRAKSGLYGKLPMNCLSLDRLDEGQLLEYIL